MNEHKVEKIIMLVVERDEAVRIPRLVENVFDEVALQQMQVNKKQIKKIVLNLIYRGALDVNDSYQVEKANHHGPA